MFSIRAKTVEGVAPPTIPARKLCRMAANDAPSQDSDKVGQIEAGQIWDFLTLKINI